MARAPGTDFKAPPLRAKESSMVGANVDHGPISAAIPGQQTVIDLTQRFSSIEMPETVLDG